MFHARQSVIGALLMALTGGGVLAAPLPPARDQQVKYVQWNRVLDTVDHLIALPESKLDIGEAALQLSSLMVPNVDIRVGMERIDTMAKRTAMLTNNSIEPKRRIEAINTVFFEEQRFAYDMDDIRGRRLENRFLWPTLLRRKGGCLTLPLLWYAIADRLGMPVFAVEAPQHTFIRYDDGTTKINIEVTSGGHPARDEYYIQTFSITEAAIKSGSLLRSLSKREYLAELIVQLGENFRLALDLGTALELEKRGLALNPRSYNTHQALAFLYNQLGYARTYEHIILARERHGNQIPVPAEFDIAIKHAKTATEMGAVPPPPEDYWKKASSRATENSSKPVGHYPVFDVATALRPDSATIHMEWHVEPDIIGSMMAPRHFGCLEDCGQMCGPPPGNLCARSGWGQ